MRDASVPPSRVLVAGVGNTLLGDDAFGPEAVRRLAHGTLPEGCHAANFGARPLDLAYRVMAGGYETVILVNAVARGGTPGTLYVLEPEDLETQTPFVAAHGVRPQQVAGTIRTLGGQPCPMLVVGCEPAHLGPEPGLSPAVEEALDEAVHLVRALAARPLEPATRGSR
ncbi:MAG TPA: hydrogenase maturation protease [Longimicrobiales bacterium]|nr:hydrogenase maturation protease [Longimicrobiales bacterium]